MATKKLSEQEEKSVAYLCRLTFDHRARLLEEPDSVRWSDAVKEACAAFDAESEAD